jgi:L-fucose isomerase-like protein
VSARLPMRIGVTAVASPLEVGAEDASTLLQQLARRLGEEPDVEVVVSPGPVVDASTAVVAGMHFYQERIDALCVVAASWYEDYLVLDLLEECPAPVVAWARPGMETGSLCGMQQLVYTLKALDHPYAFLYAAIDADTAWAGVKPFIAAAALHNRLRRARIGHLGHRVDGMTETTPHELALKKVLGPRVVPIDSQVFLQRVAQVPEHTVQQRWRETAGRVGQVTASDEAGIESLQVYTALREVIHEGGLAAVAVGCYPHLMGKVCLAASLLGEEGVPVACEGDVNGALGMAMLTWLSGEPVHNTDQLDPVAADDESSAIVYSHCGSGGFSLAARAEGIELAPVRLMHSGLCCRFIPRSGPVTLLNIVPELGGYRLAALYGQALDVGDDPEAMIFPGNPLRVQFASGYRRVLTWIAEESLGHHWMAAYGDHRPALSHLARLVGCGWTTMA